MESGAGPREGEIRLDDGRTLAYAEWGDPDGWPVLGCHGSPSSRLGRHVEDPETYRRWGARLVVPDRPGFRRAGPADGPALRAGAAHPGRPAGDRRAPGAGGPGDDVQRGAAQGAGRARRGPGAAVPAVGLPALGAAAARARLARHAGLDGPR